MDHIVYLDFKAKELENILSGKKNMIIRGAMGRKMPHGRVDENDILYFAENNGDGLIRAKGRVLKCFHSDKLSKEESWDIVEKNQKNLLLDNKLLKKFSGKRYLVLITIGEIEEIDSFKFNRSDFGNMDDWLPVGEIEKVKI